MRVPTCRTQGGVPATPLWIGSVCKAALLLVRAVSAGFAGVRLESESARPCQPWSRLFLMHARPDWGRAVICPPGRRPCVPDGPG